MESKELYNKLLEVLNNTVYGELVQLAWGEAKDILDAIWPSIEDGLSEKESESYREGWHEGIDYADNSRSCCD